MLGMGGLQQLMMTEVEEYGPRWPKKLDAGDLVRVLSRRHFDCGQSVKEIDVGIYVERSKNHVYVLGKKGCVIGYQIGMINEHTEWWIQNV